MDVEKQCRIDDKLIYNISRYNSLAKACICVRYETRFESSRPGSSMNTGNCAFFFFFWYVQTRLICGMSNKILYMPKAFSLYFPYLKMVINGLIFKDSFLFSAPQNGAALSVHSGNAIIKSRELLQNVVQ